MLRILLTLAFTATFTSTSADIADFSSKDQCRQDLAEYIINMGDFAKRGSEAYDISVGISGESQRQYERLFQAHIKVINAIGDIVELRTLLCPHNQ